VTVYPGCSFGPPVVAARAAIENPHLDISASVSEEGIQPDRRRHHSCVLQTPDGSSGTVEESGNVLNCQQGRFGRWPVLIGRL
jgi:hypothetical protein